MPRFRDSPSWLVPAAALASALLLALLALVQLASAEALDTDLKSARAAVALELKLADPLRRDDGAALRKAVSALVRESLLGLTYVAVNGVDGTILAADGRYEFRNRPLWLRPLLQALRGALYHWTGRLDRLRLQGQDGTAVEVEYVVAPHLAASIHDAAVSRLRLFGVLGLLLSALALATGVQAWRRRRPPPNPWVHRLDPDAVSSSESRPFSASAIEARVTDALYRRAGTLLEQLQRGVIIIDAEARIRYLNAVAAQLTGWPAEDVQGQLVYSVFHPLDERLAPVLTPAEIALRDDRVFAAADMRLRSRDGLQRPIEVMAAPLRSQPGGAPEGAIMLFADIAQREARNEQWRRQARLSQGVIDQLVEGVLTTDPAGVIRFANARALRLFGYARGDLEGVPIAKLMPVPFLNSPQVQLTDYSGDDRSAALPRVVGWRRDATTFPVELLVQPMTIEQSQGLLVIVRDLSERQRSENLAQRLGRLLDAAAEEVYIFDAQTLAFVEVNRGARRNLGYHVSEMTRMTPLTISEGMDAETFETYLARLRSGETEHLVYRARHRRADGSRYPVEVRLHFSREEEPPVFMAIAVDITEREQAEERLRHMAHHDALTGLPNRATLMDRLRQAILAAARGNRQLGVLFMDVDKFKSVNDSYGHEVGDAVLTQVARRVAGSLRASDTVARISGDEFVVVVPGLRSAEDALALARKIEGAFDLPLDIPGLELRITLSIGIAIYPLDESDAEGLLHHADTAMYQAKQSGPGQYRLYGTDVPPEKRRRLDLERGIASAIALNQLQLEFAPLFDLRSRCPRAALVGLYWRHPRYGRVDSAETLAAANRAGLLADLQLWRLFTATAPPLGGAGAPTLVVAMAGWQLRDPEFSVQMADMIGRNASPASRLILAVDAEGLAEAWRSSPGAIQRLADQGLRLALCDTPEAIAGAFAQASLPALELVVIDAAQADAAALTQALALARERGLAACAGAEREELLEQLQREGCDLAWGPGLGRAMELEDFAAWIKTQARDPL